MPVASDSAVSDALTGPAGMSSRYCRSLADAGAEMKTASVHRNSADADAIALLFVGNRHEIRQIDQKSRPVTNSQHP